MQSACERVWLGLAIIRFKESENAEGNPDVERYMVHGHLELRLCAMHLRSATEPTGHLSRGCMAGQTRNHLGNQAQLRVLVDSGFTGIHFRASATRCSGGELGSDRPRIRMIGRSLPKALITAWAPIFHPGFSKLMPPGSGAKRGRIPMPIPLPNPSEVARILGVSESKDRLSNISSEGAPNHSKVREAYNFGSSGFVVGKHRPVPGHDAQACRSERAHSFIAERFSERPGAVKAALGAAKRSLDGEDRSGTIPRQGMVRWTVVFAPISFTHYKPGIPIILAMASPVHGSGARQAPDAHRFVGSRIQWLARFYRRLCSWIVIIRRGLEQNATADRWKYSMR